MAFELTQTTKQRVELWIDDVLKSSHLTEGEALSKASFIHRGDPKAKLELRTVGIKRIEWFDDAVPPAPPTPTDATVDVVVGQTARLGFDSSDPAIAFVSGECTLSVVGEGNATLTPVIR